MPADPRGDLEFTNEQLTKLEQFLAGAIKGPDDIKRLIQQSGIDMAQVDLAGTPVNRWSEGVRKCAAWEKMRGLVTALTVQFEEHPKGPEFRAVIAPVVRADTSRRLIADIDWLRKAYTTLGEVEDPLVVGEALRQARRSILDLRNYIDDERYWPTVVSGALTDAEATRARDDVAEACFSLLSAVDLMLGEVRGSEIPTSGSAADEAVVASQRRAAALRARRQLLSELRQFLRLLDRRLLLPPVSSPAVHGGTHT